MITMAKIELEIVTPDRRVLKQEVDTLTIPGVQGELGVLPTHTTLLTGLGNGRLSYTVGSETKTVEIQGGVAEIIHDQVTVLADAVV